MPATTPNRGYPYPVAADPVDIPGDLQRFAEAVDADLAALTASIPIRPAVRLRGTGTQTVTTVPVLNPTPGLLFDVEDFNTGLTYTSTVITPVNGNPQTQITPLEAGFYLVILTVAVPRPTDGVNRTDLSVYLIENTGAHRAAASTHLQPSASDGIRTQSVSMGWELNGTTETIRAAFSSRAAIAGNNTFTVAERTLTIIKMSPTFP